MTDAELSPVELEPFEVFRTSSSTYTVRHYRTAKVHARFRSWRAADKRAAQLNKLHRWKLEHPRTLED